MPDVLNNILNTKGQLNLKKERYDYFKNLINEENNV